MAIEHFLKLPEEKQESILSSALNEFAMHGYEGASTNRLVEQAGISKGVLFKYFGSKENLFLFLCRHLAEQRRYWLRVVKKYLPTGFFEVLRFFAVRDLEYTIQNPMQQKLIEQITGNPSHPVYKEAFGTFKKVGDEMFISIMSAAPTEELREGVRQEDAVNMILWVFNGFNQSVRESVNGDFKLLKEDILTKIDKVFDLLKYGIYKD